MAAAAVPAATTTTTNEKAQPRAGGAFQQQQSGEPAPGGIADKAAQGVEAGGRGNEIVASATATATAEVATATVPTAKGEGKEKGAIAAPRGKALLPDGDTDPAGRAAREAAAALNAEALCATYESEVVALRRERDELRRERDAAAARQADMRRELAVVRTEMEGREGEAAGLRRAARDEAAAREEAARRATEAAERADRGAREADRLRAEVARLAAAHGDAQALLTAATARRAESASECVPLRLQAQRLEQELTAVTSHAGYLEGELADRTEAAGELRRAHAAEARQLRGDADRLRGTLESRERDLTTARMATARASAELDKLQEKLHETELRHTQQMELLDLDLRKERELILLKEQRTLLAEDQRDSLLREVEELKALANEAASDVSKQSRAFQAQLDEGIDAAVRKVRQEESQMREELQGRLEAAEEAKLRLEEDILDKATPRRRRVEGPAAPLAIAADAQTLADGDPLNLTDLYSRLAATEDDLRASRHSNQKLKILISRIHGEVAAKTPLFQQKQLELESALEQLDEAQERLDYARREASDARADREDLETRLGQAEKECGQWRQENRDLATQVQRLLQGRLAESGDIGDEGDDLVAFKDVAELQSQNQKLLRDHHTMADTIRELETKIAEDPGQIELRQLREEVVVLREEREKQAGLVAGIVHQRDLYRSLVAENDRSGGGAEQLAQADVRAEGLPALEAQNNELAEEAARLRAEVSTAKHEQESFAGRLARVDAHVEELTASNERLCGELTICKATTARAEIDVSHYQGKCERLEFSMETMRQENESEARRKGQLEELLNTTQSHLEAARGELAKKEQQYQQVSGHCREHCACHACVTLLLPRSKRAMAIIFPMHNTVQDFLQNTSPFSAAPDLHRQRTTS